MIMINFEGYGIHKSTINAEKCLNKDFIYALTVIFRYAIFFESH